MSRLEVENVIVASHLGKDVELIKLATELPNARYSSSGNPSVIIELDRTNPKFIGHKRLKAAGVLFGNGKVLVTGIASLQEGKEIIAKLKNSIIRLKSTVSGDSELPSTPTRSTAYQHRALDLWLSLWAKSHGSVSCGLGLLVVA